ncbi:MAG: TonB-dependent receptor domain-containing protein [Pseudomonadota bacterium]
MKKLDLLAAVVTSMPLLASAADEAPALPDVTVHDTRVHGATGSLSTADTAATLNTQPGVSTYAAGGVSGLPVLRGLANDRIKVLIDGAEATAACGNHMNPPLSYVDPTQVSMSTVMAGISPVSVGGDNIAGVIAVSTARPVFAADGDKLFMRGRIGLQTRSVDHGRTVSVQATAANERLSVSYSGATTEASSYRDGHGRKVLDTLFKSTNQSVSLATRGEGNLWVFKVGEQRIPYQGFANQYMDMTHNHAINASLRYEGQRDWGKLEALLFWQNTLHEMGFFSPERTGTMPMNTHGRDAGYTLKADLPLAGGTLRLGHEYRRFTLDDWWPAVPGSMMMAPNAYRNINDGQRERVALFGEWEGRIAPAWTLLAGLRAERVSSDAGAVQGYGCGMMCAADNAAAAAFNASDRSRRDNNVDATLTARLDASDTATYEFGFARKTRSPNLYERYTWGRGTMAMTMTGWFGDANGYVGDVRLKPEVAHTLSATADWHDAARERWSVKLTPFYTHVQDYIDVDTLGSFNPYMMMGETKALLRFANHDAHLYGVNLSWQAQAWSSAAWGEGTVHGKLDWTRGQRSSGGDLYHIMPLNGTVALTQRIGAWTHEMELLLVARKSRVDARRDEPGSAGYGLLNMGTRYQLGRGIEVQAGVRNLFDHAYDLPLGGVSLAALAAGAGSATPLPGQGRSIDVGISLQF